MAAALADQLVTEGAAAGWAGQQAVEFRCDTQKIE
jgi:hypothetical protein